MNSVFGDVYAGAYDAMYREKDYEGECDLLERIFRHYATGSVRTVLDMGCGTGNHALPLATRGYSVAGVDLSTEMLEAARQKAAQQNLDAQFYQGDVRDFSLYETFDAATMMFAVLGYQLSNEDVLQALKTAHRHLKEGGVLTFDVWYGLAVLNLRPETRVSTIDTERGSLLRVASGSLDVTQHRCDVRYQLWLLDGDRLVDRTAETHGMRYFFPQELALFLELAGFRLQRIGAFPDFAQDADESTWNAMVVATAV